LAARPRGSFGHEHQARTPTPPDPIRGHMLRPAGFLESQTADAQPCGRRMAHRQCAQTPPQNFGIDRQSVANAVEGEGVGGTAGVYPLARFGECAPLAGASRAVPALQNINRVHEDREHQTLLTAKSGSANCAEILTGQNDICKSERVPTFDPTVSLLHLPTAPYSWVARSKVGNAFAPGKRISYPQRVTKRAIAAPNISNKSKSLKYSLETSY